MTSSELGKFESKINNNFERWWKQNATAGRHWENKEGFRKAFFAGVGSTISKSEDFKQFRDVLGGCTDSEFVVVVTEITNTIKSELKKRLVKLSWKKKQ